MSAAIFDPDDFIREVRAKAGLPEPAKTTNLRKSEPDFSSFATFAPFAALPEQRDDPAPALFDHRCAVCGQPARFGCGVRLRQGQEGRWFCAAHRPEQGSA